MVKYQPPTVTAPECVICHLPFKPIERAIRQPDGYAHGPCLRGRIEFAAEPEPFRSVRLSLLAGACVAPRPWEIP